jgi:hypothetical protein
VQVGHFLLDHTTWQKSWIAICRVSQKRSGQNERELYQFPDPFPWCSLGRRPSRVYIRLEVHRTLSDGGKNLPAERHEPLSSRDGCPLFLRNGRRIRFRIASDILLVDVVSEVGFVLSELTIDSSDLRQTPNSALTLPSAIATPLIMASSILARD